MSRVPRLLALLFCLMLAACSGSARKGSPAAGGGGERRVLFQGDSPFSSIRVVDEGGTRCLYFGELTDERETCIDLADPDRAIFEYTRMMMTGFLWVPRSERIALIGLGGGFMAGVVLRHCPGVTLEAVEIDPVVVELAGRFFGLPTSPRLTIFVQDGREFIEQTEQRYDQLWLDAFDEDYVPRQLTTRQFLTAVKRVLKPGGILVQNLHRSHPLYKRQLATAHAVFPHHRLLAGQTSDNAVLVSSSEPVLTVAQLEANAELFGGSIGSIDLLLELDKLEPLRFPAETPVLEE